MEDECEGQSSDAAGGRQKQALAEHLTNDASALRAERRPDAELSLTDGASCQQQVGDVDAGDEQHQQHRAGKNVHCRPDLIDGLLVHRHDRDRPARVALRGFLLQLGGDGLHLVGRLRDGHAVPHPGDGEG